MYARIGIFTQPKWARCRKHQLRPYLLVHDDAMEDFKELDGQSNVNAVLVGLAPEKFTYDKLNEVKYV